MTQPTEQQHERATKRLQAIIWSRPNSGTTTKTVAATSGMSQRSVQVALKEWKTRKYGSLYNMNVVETDKTIYGCHCGVTKYTWEAKHE